MPRSELRRFAGPGLALVAAMLLCPDTGAQSGEDARLVQHAPRGGLTYDPYRPDRYLGQHRRHGQSRLRYHSQQYPYSRERYHRKSYPHSFRGTFGLPPREDKLTLRFFQGPAFSPYGRMHHPELEAYLDRYWEENQQTPLPPAAEPRRQLPDDAGQAPPVVQRRERRERPAWGAAPTWQVTHDWGLERSVPSAREIEDTDYQRAWDMLAEGEAESAQYAFAALALARSARGLPKAGYALSMALQDDLRHAAWSMRRAFKVDPETVRDLPVDQALKVQLEKLVEIYGPEGSTSVRPRDAMFMTAALHYMLRDESRALDALREAIHHGDIDASTLKLLELLGRDRRNGPRIRDDLRAEFSGAGA